MTAFLCLAQEPVTLPEGAGKAITEKQCSRCHGVAIVVNRRDDRAGWEQTVEDMLQRGMRAEDEDVERIVAYLVKELSPARPAPRVNVNSANAREIAVGLGIGESKGRAIVQAREANGKFQSMAELLQVPGLDAARIEAKRENIEF